MKDRDRIIRLARRLKKPGPELSYAQYGELHELLDALLADAPDLCDFCDKEYERERLAVKKLRGIPVCLDCERELRYEWAMEARDEDYVYGPAE